MESTKENKQMTKEELIKSLECIAKEDITFQETTDGLRIKVCNNVFTGDLKEIVDLVVCYELQEEHENILLDLKGLEVEKLAEVFKYALTREDLNDPLLILNIINLIKVYNSLDDTFFANEDIYVSSIEDLLDLKLEITSELSAFVKKVSVYFMSLFKSYNKFVYTPMDKHVKLPNVYKAIFLSTDLLTLAGIFSDSENFNTSECVLVEDAILYVTSLLMKGSMSSELIEMFLKDNNDISYQ